MSDQLVIEFTTYPIHDKHKRQIPVSSARFEPILKDDNESDQYKISYTKFNEYAHSCLGDITFRERGGIGNKRVFRTSVSHKLKRTKLLIR
jgi:hypothetical protein